jgi:hypothetical protein
VQLNGTALMPDQLHKSHSSMTLNKIQEMQNYFPIELMSPPSFSELALH